MAPNSTNDDMLNLQNRIKLLETPFSEVCQILGIDPPQPKNVVEVEDSLFMFDPERDHVFSGAVILDNEYGFFGIRIGGSWLETAERLESEGFLQAKDLDRFTKFGTDFGTCIYLYPDSDTTDSRVQHYSVCIRYGTDP